MRVVDWSRSRSSQGARRATNEFITGFGWNFKPQCATLDDFLMSSQYNRIAAFVEYCKGTNLEEISFALAIPIDHLKRWERDERWAAMVPKMEIACVPRADGDVERAQEKIKANRERNLEIFQKLQDDLLDVAIKLRAGELTVTKVFANGSRVELEPSLRDRCDLALYAKNVAEGSYRALGDVESVKNAPAPEAALPGAGQITIVLPAPVAAPRQVRAHDIEAEVVMLDVPALISSR